MIKALAGRGGLRRLDLAGPNYVGLIFGPRFALLIKATNDRIDAGSITVAVEACQSAGAREVLICVNFSAELMTAETLRRFLAIIELKSPEDPVLGNGHGIADLRPRKLPRGERDRRKI